MTAWPSSCRPPRKTIGRSAGRVLEPPGCDLTHPHDLGGIQIGLEAQVDGVVSGFVQSLAPTGGPSARRPWRARESCRTPASPEYRVSNGLPRACSGRIWRVLCALRSPGRLVGRRLALWLLSCRGVPQWHGTYCRAHPDAAAWSAKFRVQLRAQDLQPLRLIVVIHQLPSLSDPSSMEVKRAPV